MADPVVTLTNGVPTSGSGIITTLGQTLLDGANVTFGAIADAAVTAGAAGTINAHLRSISRDIAAGVVLQTGANTIGSVNQGTNPWIVSGNVTAAQGGTWNISNISGTVSLPTGAATAALQPTNATLGSTTSGQTGNLALGAVTTAAPSYVTAQTNALSLTTAGALRVDGSGASQPVTGTFWQATQPVSIAAAVTVQQSTASSLKVDLSGTGANTTALKVDGSAVTQPISAAALPLPSGAATAALQPSNAGQGSTTSGQTGTLSMGAVSSSAPTYTNGQTSPVSLTTAGAIRVDGSGFTQLVSGTVGATQSGTWSTRMQDGAGNALTSSARGTERPLSVQIVDASGNQITSFGAGSGSSFGSAVPTSGSAVGFSDGTNLQMARVFDADSGAGFQYILGTVLKKPASGGAVDFGTSSDPIRIDPTGTTTQPVSLTSTTITGTVAATQSGAWNITNITGTVSLPTGAATSAGQPTAAALGSTTSGQTGNLALGGVTTAAPTYTTGQTNALSLTTSGLLRVDGSGVTQPISVAGTVAVTQSGTWNITNITGTVSLPTGAATSALQPSNASLGSTTSGQTGHISLGAVTSAAPSYTTATSNALSLTTAGALRTDASATSQPVTGTFWQATQPVSLASVPLPTGASTAANQTNVQGVIGAATAPASMTVMGGVFNTTRPTLTNGQSAALQANNSGVLLVDGSTVTQPVSIAAAVTVQQSTASSLKVDLSGTGANATALKVDGSGVTQPISASALPLPSGAATSANQPSNAGQGSTTSGQTGTLAMGAVTTGNPTYTTGQTSPLSLDTSGAVRVNVIAGSGGGGTSSSFGSAFPSTGTALGAKDSAGTNMQPMNLDASGNLKVNVAAGGAGGGAVYGPTAVSSAAANPPILIGGTANAGATGTVQVAKVNSSGLLSVDASGATVPVSGTFWQTTQPVSGTFWQATQPVSIAAAVTVQQSTASSLLCTASQGGAPWTMKPDGTVWGITGTSANVNVSNASIAITAASLPLPSGAATAANQTVTQGVIGNATAPASMSVIGGVFNTTKPTLTTGQSSALQANSSGILLVDLSSTAANATALKVDGSAVTQPVSIAGNVTVVQSTASNLKVDLSGTAANATAIKVDGTGGTFVVSQSTAANLKGQVDPLTAASWGIGTTTQNSASATNGHMALGQFNTTPTTITSGNMSPLQVDNAGSLLVNIKSSITQAGNITQFGSSNVVTGTGAGGAGIPRVTVSNDSNVLATQSGTWTVQPGNTANTTAWLVTGTGGTFPITAASLPLPSGAATAANQTNVQGVIGNATSPASMIVTGGVFNSTKPTLTNGQSAAIQVNSSGIALCDLSLTGANATAIKVDGTGGTFVVSQSTAANLKGQVDPLTAANWGIGTSTQNSASVANGVMALAQFNTTPTTLTTGNMSPLQMDSAGNLLVNVKAGGGAGGGTSSNFAASFPTAGTAAGAKVVSSAPTYTAGNMEAPTLDTAGLLRVNVVSGGGTGGTSSTIGAALPGTATVAMGSVTTAAPSYTTATANALSLTTAGALRVDSTGNATQNSASAAGGVMALGQFNTSPVTITSGNMSPLQLDNSGNLKVVTPATVSGSTTWNSSTTLNSVISIQNNPTVLGQMTVSTTITAGAITFEESFDNGTTWVSVPAGRLINPSIGTQIGNPYTLVANTNLQFQIVSVGTTQMRIRLSTAITGTGLAIFILTSSPLLNEVQVYQNSAANLQVTAAGTVGQNSTAPTSELVVGGVYNSSAPTITSGNASQLQLDSSGNLKVTPTTVVFVSGDQYAGNADNGGPPVKIGGIGRTTNPTVVLDGYKVAASYDRTGKQLVAGAPRQLKNSTSTSITTTGDVTVISAGGSGVFQDLYGLMVTNKSATAVTVLFKEAGSGRFTIAAPAGDTRGFMLPVDSALPMLNSNASWTAAISTAVTSVEIACFYVTNV